MKSSGQAGFSHTPYGPSPIPSMDDQAKAVSIHETVRAEANRIGAQPDRPRRANSTSAASNAPWSALNSLRRGEAAASSKVLSREGVWAASSACVELSGHTVHGGSRRLHKS